MTAKIFFDEMVGAVAVSVRKIEDLESGPTTEDLLPKIYRHISIRKKNAKHHCLQTYIIYGQRTKKDSLI